MSEEMNTGMEMERSFEFQANAGAAAIQSNLDELKAFVQEVKDSYVGGEVTYENRVQAKADLASLRKLRKAVDAKVKGIRGDLMEPFTAFKQAVDDACVPIDQLIAELAGGVAKVEEQRMAEKRAHAEELRDSILADAPESAAEVLKGYWSDRWLNASTTDKQIRDGLAELVSTTEAVLDAIKGSPYEALLLDTFRKSWSYLDVVKQKAAFEAQAAEYRRVQAAKQASDESFRKAVEETRQAAAQKDARALEPKPQPQAQTEQPVVLPGFFGAVGEAATRDGEPILYCTCYLVGTREDIKAGIRAYRATGCQIMRTSEYRPASKAEADAAKYRHD